MTVDADRQMHMHLHKFKLQGRDIHVDLFLLIIKNKKQKGATVDAEIIGPAVHQTLIHTLVTLSLLWQRKQFQQLYGAMNNKKTMTDIRPE